MKQKSTFILITAFAAAILTHTKIAAQENNDSISKLITHLNDEFMRSKRLKISGYMQPQWQYIDSAGAPSAAGGDFIGGTNPYYSRFTMRRGRIKFTYEYENAQFVIVPDISEKGVFMRETFVKVTDPWMKILSVTAGLWQDQFGFELTQSSSVRETPERARVFQNLFPAERDLGVFLTAVAPKKSALQGLKADLAVMNGSAGIAPEFDNHKDFTGRISYSKTSKNEKKSIGFGFSGYYGGYKIGSVRDYTLTPQTNGELGFSYAPDTANYNRVAKRQYIGYDLQISVTSKIGTTVLRGEYIEGQQPGTDKSSKSLGALPASSIYHRSFNGGYLYLIQDIGKSKFQLVAKYDWYDPNTWISGKQIGSHGTNTKIGDIRFDTYGFGVNYKVNSNVKLTGYYDYVINEATSIAAYSKDIPDNVVTVRLQYKF
ncbi:MAG: hypothetical protein ACJ77K_05285 [Bacteroidia bacterium]